MFDWLTKASTLELVIWSIFIGVSIGVFGIFYTRRILGKAVRKLLENGCTSPNKGMTLGEIGCGKNYLVKFSTKYGILKSVLKKSDESVRDLENTKFYIEEQKKISMELRFSGKDTDVFGIIIAISVFGAVAYAMTRLVPYITSLIENMV